MLKLQTNIEGKKTSFGYMREMVHDMGFYLGGGWEFHKGSFDNVLWREGGETIYIRIPFRVRDGELDHYDAAIEFMTPFVIKHVVNIGLDSDENSLMGGTLNQFQDPLDTDGHIEDKNKWETIGEQTVEQFISYLQ